MIQHLLFDLDDTLWDFKRNSEACLRKLFAEQGVERNFRLSFEEWHPKYYEFNEALWADLRDKKIEKSRLRELRFKNSFEFFNIYDKRLNETFETQYLEKLTLGTALIENAESVLQELEKQFEIHVVTNGFQDVSERKIGNSNLKKYVKTLTSADSAGVRKPDPKIFDMALETAQATRENVLFIGDDWIADIQGAHAYGIPSVFLNTHKRKVNNNLNVPEIQNLNELPKLITELCKKG